MNSGFPAGRIDLDRLRAGPIEWSGILPAETDAWGLPGLEWVEDPSLDYRAESGGHGGVRVTGRLSGTVRLECRRCLEPLRRPLNLEFDLRFDPAVREWEEEAGVFAMDADDASLDLARPLREELALALPEYPVCRESCRGLCPVCGVDRNEDDCRCDPREADPRWDALRQLTSEGRRTAAGPDGVDDGNDG